MRQLTRVEATSRLDTQIVTLLEGIDAQRAEIASTYNAGKLLTDHGASDGSAASAADDLLGLNIGGSLCSMRRKHMTLVEGTTLASLFSGRWDRRFVRDGDSRVFLDVCPAAFEAIQDAIYADGKEAVAHLMGEAAKRNHQGPHDFWFLKLLTSPASQHHPRDDGPADDHIDAADMPSISKGKVPRLHGFVAAVESFLNGYLAKHAEVEKMRREKKAECAELMAEIKAFTSFLKPLAGDGAIRSVTVSGRTLSTTQATVDEMSDTLRNRFDLWPAPIEDVPVDHVRRLIDHYRRKRHAAGAGGAQLSVGVDVPLRIAGSVEQHWFRKTATMYGVDLSMHGLYGVDVSMYGLEKTLLSDSSLTASLMECLQGAGVGHPTKIQHRGSAGDSSLFPFFEQAAIPSHVCLIRLGEASVVGWIYNKPEQVIHLVSLSPEPKCVRLPIDGDHTVVVDRNASIRVGTLARYFGLRLYGGAFTFHGFGGNPDDRRRRVHAVVPERGHFSAAEVFGLL